MPESLIESFEGLASYFEADRFNGGVPVCAIDTEADSLHRYKESLCLIQFAAGDDCFLIDPLAIGDLSVLSAFLEKATVWMHGADYDMTMLKRQFGSLPPVVYDTQIGARLLGARRFGLADLVLHFFGVELSKSSQKADWGKRPLTSKMIEYALNDARYLLPMADRVVERLKEKGRYPWFVESCEVARARVLERSDESRDDAWRIKGSGKLDPKTLACLRALWNWRDSEASRWDRPPFMVASNSLLLEWSSQLAQDRRIDLPRHFRPDRVKRFRQIRDDLAKMPESEWPARLKTARRKRDREFDNRVESLLKRRDKAATDLDIEGSLIISRSVVESLAAEESTPAAVLLNWQREVLGIAEGAAIW